MSHQNVEQKKKGVYKNLLSGGISASIARTVTNPIERLEILRQVGNTDYKGLSLSDSVKKFYKSFYQNASKSFDQVRIRHQEHHTGGG